jgi:hypothetical protein
MKYIVGFLTWALDKVWKDKCKHAWTTMAHPPACVDCGRTKPGWQEENAA